MDLSSYFRAYDLPAPVAEHRFHPERRWRFDSAWLEWKVAMEIDGGVWTGGRHTRGRGFTSDMEKLNEAAIEGWLVVRVIPSQIRSGTAAQTVKRALVARGWKGEDGRSERN